MSTTKVRVSHQSSIATALAEYKKRGEKHNSMASLCRAVGITDYPAQVAVRQHFRDAGLGVGRGKTYKDVTPAKVSAVVAGNAKQEKAKAAATAKAPAKKRAAAKASTLKPAALEPVA